MAVATPHGDLAFEVSSLGLPQEQTTKMSPEVSLESRSSNPEPTTKKGKFDAKPSPSSVDLMEFTDPSEESSENQTDSKDVNDPQPKVSKDLVQPASDSVAEVKPESRDGLHHPGPITIHHQDEIRGSDSNRSDNVILGQDFNSSPMARLQQQASTPTPLRRPKVQNLTSTSFGLQKGQPKASLAPQRRQEGQVRSTSNPFRRPKAEMESSRGCPSETETEVFGLESQMLQVLLNIQQDLRDIKEKVFARVEKN